MPNPSFKKLEEYKKYVKKRLSELTPIFQKAAMGDFRGKVEIPLEEDEYSELLVGLSLMMDDLRQLEMARKKNEETKKERLFELEKWSKFTIGRELKMVELKKEIKKLKEEIKNFKNKLRKHSS